MTDNIVLLIFSICLFYIILKGVPAVCKGTFHLLMNSSVLFFSDVLIFSADGHSMGNLEFA